MHSCQKPFYRFRIYFRGLFSLKVKGALGLYTTLLQTALYFVALTLHGSSHIPSMTNFQRLISYKSVVLSNLVGGGYECDMYADAGKHTEIFRREV